MSTDVTRNWNHTHDPQRAICGRYGRRGEMLTCIYEHPLVASVEEPGTDITMLDTTVRGQVLDVTLGLE